MSANQRVTCSRMVEGHGSPSGRAMATGAIGAARTAVGVILGMAGNAGGSQSLPALSGVA